MLISPNQTFCPVSVPEYLKGMYAAYSAFQAKYPRTNEAAYEKACKPILELCASLDDEVDITRQESKRSTVGRMTSIKRKFTDLVCCPFVITFSRKHI
jgi:hypothetical protein